MTDYEMRGARVVLTSLHYANLYTHFRWNNDAGLNRLDSEAPFEPEPLGCFKQRFEQMVFRPDPTERWFEVHTREGLLVGVTSLQGIAEAHGRADVAVTIARREQWGRGYGREALRLVTAHAFGSLGLHRLRAVAYGFNAAWRTLLESEGFHAEGRLREHLFRDGRYWDRHQYGLLAREHAGLARAA